MYGNNSFLLHGYYNYRYLILARLGKPGERGRYILACRDIMETMKNIWRRCSALTVLSVPPASRRATAGSGIGIRI
ncbi:hypothetical protein [Clostridium sp. AF22-10]|uniref:hypothetical protein n=1 Tax=Clostridium sp. AF22-10 TaxID=2293004 RepID=UPI00399D5322